MDSARRWSGFVCPDCRFVFRVPKDHDGSGVVCPSCRRLMKIPTAEDAPTPLISPLQAITAGEMPQQPERRTNKKKRRSKKQASEDHTWEHQARTSRTGRGEKGRMRLFLIGGSALLCLILGGVIYSMKGPGEAGAITRTPATPVTPPTTEPLVRGDSAFLTEAEPLARRFLEASTVEEMLPLVHNPQVAEGRMRAFYQDKGIEAPGMSRFNAGSSLFRKGNVLSVRVATKDYGERPLAFIESSAGLKIDWESWTGWSEMPWRVFIKSKAPGTHVFRVILSPVDYYNFDFTDDLKWQSYRLTSPDGEHSIYGYVEKGSLLAKRVHPDADTKSSAAMLELEFPENPVTDNQVIIRRFVADGWVETGP